MNPMILGVLGALALVAFWWASVLRSRKHARENARALHDGAAAELPNLKPRLETALTDLSKEAPLPAWCRESLEQARHAGEQAEAALRDAIHEVRRLLRNDKPCQAASAAEGIPAIHARHQAAVNGVLQARELLASQRLQALVEAGRARQAVREAISTLRSFRQEGWRLSAFRKDLALLVRRSAELLRRARKPDEEHLAVIQESSHVAMMAREVVQQARKHTDAERSQGRYPVPLHPLFELCRRQEVVLHQGRAYLLEGGEAHEGPSLTALDQVHQHRNAAWAGQRKQECLQKEFQDAETLQALSDVERAVHFVLTEVFPHFRVAGEAVPAQEDDAGQESLAAILTARMTAVRQDAARKAPPRIGLRPAREHDALGTGDLVRLTGNARKHNYPYVKTGSEGVILEQVSPRKYRVRFTLITGKRWRPKHGDTWEVHADCLERATPGGSTTERAVGSGSILIRKDGTIAELVPESSGAITLNRRHFAAYGTGHTLEALMDAMDYWTRQDLRMEALQDALEGGKGLPADVLHAKAITAAGRYAKADHRLEVAGGTVWVYLRVPPFALKENGREVYHAFPEMEVGVKVKRSGGRFACGDPVMFSDVIHPFAWPQDHICTAGKKPQGTGSDGEYVAAYLFLARDVLRTAYRPSRHGPQTGWMEDADRHRPTIVPKEELVRRAIPVTNVTH